METRSQRIRMADRTRNRRCRRELNKSIFRGKNHVEIKDDQDVRVCGYDCRVHTGKVFSNDKPFAPGNTTKPRTEMRFDDYTSGQHQYSADLMVPSGTGGVDLMQIHTGNAQSPKFGATTLMLFFETSNGGSLHLYSGTQLASNLYNKWFHLNVIHDTRTGLMTVYVNGTLVLTKHDNGAGDFYMKTGVYAQNGETKKMEVFIKNLTLWSK